MAAGVMGSAACVVWWRLHRRQVPDSAQVCDDSLLDALWVALVIHVAVCVASASWGYRYVFVLPACVVFVSGRAKSWRFLGGMGCVIAFLPLIPGGWLMFNPLTLCFAAALMAFGLHRILSGRQQPGAVR